VSGRYDWALQVYREHEVTAFDHLTAEGKQGLIIIP